MVVPRGGHGFEPTHMSASPSSGDLVRKLRQGRRDGNMTPFYSKGSKLVILTRLLGLLLQECVCVCARACTCVHALDREEPVRGRGGEGRGYRLWAVVSGVQKIDWVQGKYYARAKTRSVVQNRVFNSREGSCVGSRLRALGRGVTCAVRRSEQQGSPSHGAAVRRGSERRVRGPCWGKSELDLPVTCWAWHSSSQRGTASMSASEHGACM